MQDVAVLYVRGTSVYYRIHGCDPYDERRDARTFASGCPVVAHPPCRAWGRLRGFARPASHEKELALRAVETIRANGGVLEHPASSTLWDTAGLPKPGTPPDSHGGYSIQVDQWWWGHKAAKRTWLYIVGCPKERLPRLPPVPSGSPLFVVTTRLRKGQPGWRPEISKKDRERTPPEFAHWLVEVARRCRRHTL